MFIRLHHFLIYLIAITSLWGCAAKQANKPDLGPSPPKTPREELASFSLEQGLKAELVAAEPMVQDPVVITFDADGRLWVVEMRGFMPTIDGEGENEPTGRVSVLEDTNGDGQMDVSTIYLDSLIMPRAIALVPGGALIAENKALWITQDLDNDLKADTKTLIDADYAGSGLPEHSGNGLWRGMDNWYYNVKSRFRYRLMDGQWQRDSTEFRGQWGISHDDKGRLFYNYNWSQLHADLVAPNYLSGNPHHTSTTGIDHGLTIDRRIYPIRPNPAVNRGYIPGTLDEQGRLLEFTAACSPHVYRETAFPQEYYGNVFVCEPSGNLIKRNVVEEKGWMLRAYDPHPGKEFLASTDERFRPVHMATGPDGALYVADMYRGLVQHGAYITPYLREQTLQRKLVGPVNYGRIWRIVPEKWKPSKPTKLSQASNSELIATLSHPNGWHRDRAQQLLIDRNDTTIAEPLIKLALEGNHHLGRFHALWTMDGLKIYNAELLLRLLTDSNALIRSTALRLLEPLAKSDKQVCTKLEAILLSECGRAPAEQVLQMALSARVLSPEAAHPLLAHIAERYDTSALIRDAIVSSLQEEEFAFLKYVWTLSGWQTHRSSGEILLEMLTTAIVRKRDAAELTTLLTMLDANKQTVGWKEKAVLTAMSIAGSTSKADRIKLAAVPNIVSRPASRTDSARLRGLATLFDWPGNMGVVNTSSSKKYALNEEEQKLFALGRKHYLTTCAGCHGTDGAGLNRFAPPLIGSDWVLGDEKRLALIILHGMEGAVKVNGKVYNTPDILPVMPAHSTMDDAAISAILTYIRNEWGNDAGPVSRHTVGTTRNTSQGRVTPWTAEELDNYVAQTREQAGKQ